MANLVKNKKKWLYKIFRFYIIKHTIMTNNNSKYSKKGDEEKIATNQGGFALLG